MIVETPVELWVNNEKNITFMCSPYNLEELAIGHILTRGIADSYSDIINIEVKEDTNQVFIKTLSGRIDQLYTVPQLIVSGTSSVSEFNDNIYKIPKIENNYSVPLETIVKFADKLVNEAIIYKATGGVHGSILYSSDDIYYLREDIGRHCSVDKAIGAARKDNIDFSNSFICTTGRISLDMIIKAAVVGIPIVASLKYPSDMGVNLANHYGITIAARVLEKEPLIFGNLNRVVQKRVSV